MKYFDVWRDVVEYTEQRHGRRPSVVYVVGRRGVGKTHSALKECLRHSIRGEGRFVYVRRVTTEIATTELNAVFTDVIKDPEVIEEISNSIYAGFERYVIVAKSGAFWLCGIDESDTLSWLDKVGVATCISRAEHFKGGTYSDYDRVIFDEFISEMRYVRGDKEPELFQKIVATIGRKPNDERASKNVITYLCGNPDNSIEGCPYLYRLHLDYSNMSPNIPYYYERKNGEITTFTKIVKNIDDTYIDPSVSDIFDTAEEIMSQTGEMKENSYILITPEMVEAFEPMFKLIVETPVISNKAYHKVIYANYGLIRPRGFFPEYALFVTAHDIFKDCKNALFCRYDEEYYKPRKMPQTFRIRIPHNEKFAELLSIIAHVDQTRLIFTTANRLATLFESVRENSK